MTQSTLADIIAAVPRRDIDHPQFIEGRLYLTEDQWGRVLADLHDFPVGQLPLGSVWRHGNQAEVWRIPVEIIGTSEPITLPSGRRLVHSKFMPDKLIIMMPENPIIMPGVGLSLFPEKPRPKLGTTWLSKLSIQTLFESFNDDLWGNLADTIHEFSRSMLDVLESGGTRRHALYAVLNMPWRAENWRWLRAAPTKRKLRQLRENWETEDHVRAIRKVKKSTPITTEGMNS